MLLNHSPNKQNRSPQTRKKQKSKEIKTSHQLLQLLIHSHITLSSHLTQHILSADNQSNQLKLFNKNEQEATQLKVKLADYEFQLKKINEDFAQFQLLAKMQKDKALRRLREELDAQRVKNIEDNTKWQIKFAQRQQQYQNDILNFKQKVIKDEKKKRQTQITNLQQYYKNKIQKLIIQNSSKIIQLQNLNKQQINKLQNIISQQKLKNVIQIQYNKNKYQQIIKQNKQIYQNKIINIQYQKNIQYKIIQNNQKQNINLQQKYLYIIGTLQSKNHILQNQIQQFKIKYKILEKKYQDKIKQNQQIKKYFTIQLQSLQTQKNKALEQAREIVAKEKIQFLRQQYTKSQQLQHKLQKLAHTKTTMQTSYDSLLRSLQIRFERRQSKREDIEVIRQYQQQLLYKQRENSQIYQQLKMVQLEKQNNDKIYTRIFTSNKKDKKSLSNKTDHDIHTLLKQSQTTDFRHLLRLAGK